MKRSLILLLFWIFLSLGCLGEEAQVQITALPQTTAAPVPDINSFEDCLRAGYPVMESYPRQCRTPDGRTFVEVLEEPVRPSEAELPQTTTSNTFATEIPQLSSKFGSELKMQISEAIAKNDTDRKLSIIIKFSSEPPPEEILRIERFGVDFTKIEGEILHAGKIYTGQASINSILFLKDITIVERVEYGGHKNIPTD